MAKHASCSPSGSAKWMGCPGSLAMEQDIPNVGSKYSAEGTAAHFLASTCLDSGHFAADYLNAWIDTEPTCAMAVRVIGEDAPDTSFKIDTDMARHVQCYVDAVRQYAEGGDLLVEQRLSLTDITGEEGAEGTSDAVVFNNDGKTMYVIDLKYGMGELVSPVENSQLMIYALAALPLAELFGYEVFEVVLVIHQPRVNATPQEYRMPISKLLDFGDRVKDAAYHAQQCFNEKPEALIHHLRPSEKACRWCRAKAICPKIKDVVVEVVGFEAIEDVVEAAGSTAVVPGTKATTAIAEIDLSGQTPEQLGQKMLAAPLVEMWCKAVRAEAERRLLAGEPVPGWKIVQGKRGNRKWADEAEAEKLLKGMRIKDADMYDFKLMSPTTAEKRVKEGIIGERQWNKIKALVTQAEGGPSVAPESDKRPALNLACAFVAIEESAEDLC